MSGPKLLSGGNPQIAKGSGDGPVQAWIDAVPGWKRDVARRLDTLVTATVPDVRKAVKWNSPLYGMGESRWFLGLHAYDRYLKLAFFEGAVLEPPPPVGSKQPSVRYAHIHEGDAFDAAQLSDWIAAASRLPGAKM